MIRSRNSRAYDILSHPRFKLAAFSWLTITSSATSGKICTNNLLLYTFINGGYMLLGLTLMGAIIGIWC